MQELPSSLRFLSSFFTLEKSNDWISW